MPRAAVRYVLVDEYIREKWTRKWKKYPKCRQTKKFFSEPNKGKSQKLLELGREQLTVAHLARSEVVGMMEKSLEQDLRTNRKIYWTWGIN